MNKAVSKNELILNLPRSSSYWEETGPFKREEEKMSWLSLDLVETRWDSVTTMDTASLRIEDGEGCEEAWAFLYGLHCLEGMKHTLACPEILVTRASTFFS